MIQSWRSLCPHCAVLGFLLSVFSSITAVKWSSFDVWMRGVVKQSISVEMAGGQMEVEVIGRVLTAPYISISYSSFDWAVSCMRMWPAEENYPMHAVAWLLNGIVLVLALYCRFQPGCWSDFDMQWLWGCSIWESVKGLRWLRSWIVCLFVYATGGYLIRYYSVIVEDGHDMRWASPWFR